MRGVTGLLCAKEEWILWAVPLTPHTLCGCSWLDDSPARNFDVFALYYGSDEDHFTCPECVGILHQAGVKWHLVYRLSQLSVWQGLLQRYKYFMVPDDDLLMSTHSTY